MKYNQCIVNTLSNFYPQSTADMSSLTFRNRHIFLLIAISFLLLPVLSIAQSGSYFTQVKEFGLVSEENISVNNVSLSGAIYAGKNLIIENDSRISNGQWIINDDQSPTSLIIEDTIKFKGNSASLIFTDQSLLKSKDLSYMTESITDSSRIYSLSDQANASITVLNSFDTLISPLIPLVNKEELFNFYRNYSVGLYNCFPNGQAVKEGTSLKISATDPVKTTIMLFSSDLIGIDKIYLQGDSDDQIVINLDFVSDDKVELDFDLDIVGLETENIIWNIMSMNGVEFNGQTGSLGTVINSYSKTTIINSLLEETRHIAKSIDMVDSDLSVSSAPGVVESCTNCPLSFVSLGGHRQVCAGNVIEICADVVAGVAPYNYQWNNGSTTRCLEVLVDDHRMLHVEVSDALGCKTSDEIFIEKLIPAAANAGQDMRLCGQQSVTLTANGGETYLWSTGETGHSIVVNPDRDTTYTVIVSDVAGCTSSDEVIIEVDDLAIITGTVFADVDYNEKFDGHEIGISAVMVNLMTENQQMVLETTTDLNGEYTLETCPGEYLIDVILPDGYHRPAFEDGRLSIMDVASGDQMTDQNIALRSGSVVPLEWLDMSLLYEDHSNSVKLMWATAQEINVDKFEVYYSQDGLSWSIIGNKKAANELHNRYEFYHQDPRGSEHYYRVKQIDYNESFSWSDTKKIELRKDEEVEISFYPNPTKDILNVEYSRPIDMEVEIYTKLGQKLEVKLVDKQIDIRHLPKGGYIISFRNKESLSLTVDSFVKL